MTKLRIAYITPEFLPVRGGVSVYSINLLKGLLSYDIEVHVITTRKNNINMEKDIAYLHNDRLYIHNISNFYDNLSSHIKFQYAIAKVLPKLNTSINFDLIHSNFPVNGDMLYSLFSNKLPIVTTIHGFADMLKETIKASLNFTPESFLDASERSILRYQPFFSIMEKLYLKKIHHAIAVSKYAASLTSRYIPAHKISVVYHGIDTRLFNNNIDNNDKEPIILFLSRFATHKGIYTFLKALQLILNEVPHAKILIGGHTDNKFVTQYVKNVITHSTNINFIGYVPNYTELPMLYTKANIFVSSSFEDLLGFRLLEAMCCKLAVVATNIGGVPELIKNEHNGLLVNPGDYNMLAHKIITLCQDSSLRQRLANNAHNTVISNFTSEIMTKNTLDVYYKTLNKN